MVNSAAFVPASLDIIALWVTLFRAPSTWHLRPGLGHAVFLSGSTVSVLLSFGRSRYASAGMKWIKATKKRPLHQSPQQTAEQRSIRLRAKVPLRNSRRELMNCKCVSKSRQRHYGDPMTHGCESTLLQFVTFLHFVLQTAFLALFYTAFKVVKFSKYRIGEISRNRRTRQRSIQRKRFRSARLKLGRTLSPRISCTSRPP